MNDFMDERDPLLFVLVVIFLSVAWGAVIYSRNSQDIEQQKPENEMSNWTKIGSRMNDHGLYRYFDVEAGAVCWIYQGSGGSGISCLPLEQTRLEQK